MLVKEVWRGSRVTGRFNSDTRGTVLLTAAISGLPALTSLNPVFGVTC